MVMEFPTWLRQTAAAEICRFCWQSSSERILGSGGSPVNAGTHPLAVVTGDFNGDGFQDLATFNLAGLVVLLGNGAGAFTPTSSSPLPFTKIGMAVGDFNSDGIQDLVMQLTTSETCSCCCGDGAGGFASASAGSFATGSAPKAVAVGDFNLDSGAQDVAVANSGSANVTVLLGNSSGGFTAALEAYAVGSLPESLVVGDFNSDGVQDLAVSNYNSNNVTVLIGSGTGGFTPAAGSPFAAGSNPQTVVTGDFNGDGIPDLAVANSMEIP